MKQQTKEEFQSLVEAMALEMMRARGFAPPKIMAKIDPPAQDLPEPPKHEPSLKTLAQAAALRCGVTYLELISDRRFKPLVRARMIYFALAKQRTSKSIVSIGRYCGRRDHTTVLHGLRRVAESPSEFEPELSELLAAFPMPVAPDAEQDLNP